MLEGVWLSVFAIFAAGVFPAYFYLAATWDRPVAVSERRKGPIPPTATAMSVAIGRQGSQATTPRT